MSNRQIYLPGDSGSPTQEFLLTLVKRNSWGGDPESRNYGRSNKLPIKIIIFFSLSVLLTLWYKNTNNDWSGNRLKK